MILRTTLLILLGCSLAYAHPNATNTKPCSADKKNCSPETSPAVAQNITVEIMDTNTATLNRLDSEGFTVRLDCSKFGDDRAKDAKAFLLDLNTPEECQKDSPVYGERVLILINPTPVYSAKPQPEESSPLPAAKP